MRISSDDFPLYYFYWSRKQSLWMGNGMRRWLDVALTALLLTFDRKRSADGRITTFAYGLWPCRAPSSFVPYSPACGIITVTSHWTTLSTFFSNGMNGRQAIHVARTTKCNKIKKTSNFFLCVWRAISGRHNTRTKQRVGNDGIWSAKYMNHPDDCGDGAAQTESRRGRLRTDKKKSLDVHPNGNNFSSFFLSTCSLPFFSFFISFVYFFQLCGIRLSRKKLNK